MRERIFGTARFRSRLRVLHSCVHARVHRLLAFTGTVGESVC